MLLIIVTGSACAGVLSSPSGTQSPAPVLNAIPASSPASAIVPAVVENPTAEPTPASEPAATSPAGLRVVYLLDGNLWSWTAANRNVMLTGTGDMSTVRLSSDGELLGFMRGKEVWTIRMDGTEARPLVILEEEEGSLSFSPDSSMLAVATNARVDLIDLGTATTRTVLTYPALPDGYLPEIVWAVDSTGFKTVIPAAIETGQAEYVFISINAMKASLAKFSMVALETSQPFISPDGGYVIYVAGLPGGKLSLYLMDSSGATKPYGDPSDSVRACGWMPDSQHFAYSTGKQNQVRIGNVSDGAAVETGAMCFERIRWLDAKQFLGVQDENLYLGDIQGQTVLIAEGVTGFDFSN